MLSSQNTRLETPNICINPSLYFQTFSHNTTISVKNVITQFCVCVLTISESRINRCPTSRHLKNATQVTYFKLILDHLLKTDHVSYNLKVVDITCKLEFILYCGISSY